MVPYRVVPLPDPVSRAVRTAHKSPGYGHDAQVEVATGSGPCRSCLRQFRVGEERRILFTFDAFDGLDPYPSPGPVFVHEDDCEPFAGPGFPPELRSLPMTLEAYAAGRWLVARERVGAVDGEAGNDVESAIGRLFAEPAVEYIHVRNSEAGCFMAWIERAAAQEGEPC